MLKYLFAFCLLFPAAAFADKIDGSWCNEKGAHIAIDGPKISLSGQPSIDGQYARHTFSYTVPPGAEQAGDQVFMQLRDEQDMTSYIIKDGTPVDPVEWKRCQATS